jgi:hypothetical protein
MLKTQIMDGLPGRNCKLQAAILSPIPIKRCSQVPSEMLYLHTSRAHWRRQTLPLSNKMKRLKQKSLSVQHNQWNKRSKNEWGKRIVSAAGSAAGFYIGGDLGAHVGYQYNQGTQGK